MPRHPLSAFCILALFARATCAFAAPPAPQPIFDGKTLAGWSGGTTEWRVADSAITGEIAAGTKLAKNEFLYWQGEVADFELTAEFRLTGPAAANSGIQFRSSGCPTAAPKATKPTSISARAALETFMRNAAQCARDPRHASGGRARRAAVDGKIR